MKRTTILILVTIILGVSLYYYFGITNKPFNKVLIHYKQEDPNPEKLKAAQFLIDNLEYNYSYCGDAYADMSKIYGDLAKVPKLSRDNMLLQKNANWLISSLHVMSDKDVVTADFLIGHIDIAFDTWKNAPWNKEVSFNNFCEYILPYKYGKEGISDFYSQYHDIYSPLLNSIYFEAGEKYYAVNQNPQHAQIISGNKEGQQFVKLKPNTTALMFDSVISANAGRKTLVFHYSNTDHWNKVLMVVNKHNSQVLNLQPLDNLQTNPIHPLKVQIDLKKGVNTIEFYAVDDVMAIDYIEIIPYEKYYYDFENFKIKDGASYAIKNVASNKYLEVNERVDKTICVDKKNEMDSNPRGFHIQNADYGFFVLQPENNTSEKANCLDAQILENSHMYIGCNPYNYLPKQLWAIIPVGENQYKIMNKNTGKCIEASLSNNSVFLNTYEGAVNQHWQFLITDTCSRFDKNIHVPQHSVLAATRRIAPELDFNWQHLNISLPHVTTMDILKTKIGGCHEETQYFASILRSLGIPTAVDNMPLCAFSTIGHEFNSIIDQNNQSIYCQVTLTPGVGLFNLPVSKVLRKRFSVNPQSPMATRKDNEWIPSPLNDAHIIDITSDYIPTSDVTIDLYQSAKNEFDHVYVCVNNREWQPVGWGEVANKTCQFKNLGLDVLYLPVYYSKDKTMKAVSYPFVLHKDSTVQTIKPDMDVLETIVLKRKFLWGGFWSNNRMNNGRFQGANKPDFSDAVTLYTYKGDTEPVFYNIPVNCNKEFKYVRYIGAEGCHSTLCELSFKDENDEKISGTPIGTPGSFKNLGNTIEKAFDNDILTFYDGPTASNSWVGLKLDKPSIISDIRFIPRNDGNCIEIGDHYELEYWNNNEWVSLGSQVAESMSLR